MKITSPVFENGEFIPEFYTCDGASINPPLAISDVPTGTQSLALVFEDSDAPLGAFIQWIIWNINSNSDVIPENSVLPGAIQGVNGWGNTWYDGPCPQSGTHHYTFRVFALDKMIDFVKEGASWPDLETAINGHILEEANLVGLYSKKD